MISEEKILPKNWKLVKLGEVCNIIMGQSPPSTSYNTDGVGMPFFQGKAEFTDLYPIVEKWCDAPNKIAEPNDILLSVRAPVGTTNIANQKCCIGRGLAAIRYENYKYAFYFLRSRQQELDSKGTGTTFRAISGETIRETLFPFPPKTTQLAIVSKIEELFSELDKGIENLHTAQQQLKTYRQSVLKWAFEGKLTNENLKDGELPKGWKLQKLNAIGEWKGGGTPSKANKTFWEKGNILWVSPKDMKSKVIRDTIDKITLDAIENSSTKLINKGSILFVVRSGILRRTLPVAITICDVTVNQDLQAFTPKGVIPDYVYWYVQAKNEDIRRDCSKDGTTVESIESSLLKNYLIPICSNMEQNMIIQEIESRLSVADKMEESITQSLQQAEALRQSILKKAFEGKLV